MVERQELYGFDIGENLETDLPDEEKIESLSYGEEHDNLIDDWDKE